MQSEESVIHFSIANFNVNNLVSPNVAYYGSLSYTQELYSAKLQWCSEQLRRMNADVVVFQEVFHTEALQDLCTRSGLYSEAHILAPHTGEEKPRVAIVSKFPITEFSSHAEIPLDCRSPEHSQFRRPPLQATIQLSEGCSIRLFAVHLKSKRPEYLDRENPEDLLTQAKGAARSLRIRSGEAVAIRKLLL